MRFLSVVGPWPADARLNVSSSTSFLRLHDSLTRRTATLRLAETDIGLSLGQLLHKYLLRLDDQDLPERGAITPEALLSLQAIQDLVYACDDFGNLTNVFSGVAFRQDDRTLELHEVPSTAEIIVGDTDASLTEIAVDRLDVGYERNWTGFHRRRWRNDPSFFEAFVAHSLEGSLGASTAASVMALDSHADRLKFLDSLAKAIWESEFENYSRFTGQKLMFKAGDETVRNISGGAGGICTEKVQALKFLTDHYGFESEYLIGGDEAKDPAPVARLREMLRTFDFRFARRYMRYWQHAALLYNVDGVPVLVDATNGNIPYLFLVGDDAEQLLGYEEKPFVAVKMVEAEERYYYHRAPQDIPRDLFFAMEGWLGDTDMVQVFENELGLFLSGDYYVTPIPYRSDQEFRRLAAEYQEIARRAAYRCQVDRNWTLDTELGQQFCETYPGAAEGILAAKEHLLLRYNGWDVPGHEAGLVVMRMT